MMVAPPAPATAAGSPSQDAAQPHAHPAVHLAQGRGRAVLEVFKPAFQGAIGRRDDLAEAVPVGPSGLVANGVSNLPKAFAAWPMVAPLEVIAKEIEAALPRGVHHARLVRMQPQSGLRSLRSTPVTALPRYYGRSDSCKARSFGTWVLERRLAALAGLPASRACPSAHSASNHLTLPAAALTRYPSARQASPPGRGPGFAIPWRARRCVRPNRVRHPAD